MIEMMLMGFLMDGEKTGYEIKKYMENSTHYFFNTGFSSIYPKLKKLEKEERVRVSQVIKNGKLNKLYTLTDEGKKAFLEWLEIKPEIGRIRDEALLKVFFFDHLEDDKIVPQLKGYVGDLSQHVQNLLSIKERLSTREVEVEPWKMMTLEFGIRYYNFLEQIFNEMLLKNSPDQD
ncbi:Transcriptional regulator (PadR family protein) [Desulfamplus magnetovallimortis]|uniref:Transcriptional regulator (PadR family protein) n=1 Tax=Desulfamplus magnetovallimortis TaxID=1246637 RepID=A0A1W1H9H9_9BACT|nr:PadR family transcriptional regulator [Desulfamplus magnetovallimortis]SLM29096.1 Transcriptional regulator (PadR family protein) [Desulfamplus magnetovallimortis]